MGPSIYSDWGSDLNNSPGRGLGTFRGSPGEVLEPPGGHFGPFGPSFGALWGHLGPLWALLGAILGACGGNLLSNWVS